MVSTSQEMHEPLHELIELPQSLDANVEGFLISKNARVGLLPPDEFWISKPNKPIPTPTDARNLVDMDSLIGEVMQLVSPEYNWEGYSDLHHLNWPCGLYLAARKSGTLPLAVRFRELPPNKVWLPRVFHNVIHKVTLPPPMPNHEVMERQIDAWDVSVSFFRNLRLAANVERRSKVLRPTLRAMVSDEEVERVIAERQERLQPIISHFKGQARQNFKLLQNVMPGVLPFETAADPEFVARKAGQLVMHGSHYRMRQIRSAA